MLFRVAEQSWRQLAFTSNDPLKRKQSSEIGYQSFTRSDSTRRDMYVTSSDVSGTIYDLRDSALPTEPQGRHGRGFAGKQ